MEGTPTPKPTTPDDQESFNGAENTVLRTDALPDTSGPALLPPLIVGALLLGSAAVGLDILRRR